MYAIVLLAKALPNFLGMTLEQTMRTFLMICSLICVPALLAAKPAHGQQGLTDKATTTTKAVSRVTEIATEEDLLAYQAMINSKKPRINLSLPDVASQVANIERHITDGITFSELGGSDLRKVKASLKAFAGMAKELDDPAHDMDISPELWAEQDKLNAILNKAQMDSVFECYSTQTTGTHFVVRKCRTVAQLRRMRDRDQDGFRRRVENKLDAARNGSSGQNGASFGDGL